MDWSLPTRTLPAGVWFQIRPSSLPGRTLGLRRHALQRLLEIVAALGCAGVVVDVGARESFRQFVRAVRRVRGYGLECLAGLRIDAWTADPALVRLVALAGCVECAGVVLDLHPSLARLRPRALRRLTVRVGAAIRNALLIDQPWDRPVRTLQHTTRALARIVDVRAPRLGVNAPHRGHDPDRYLRGWPRHERVWARLERLLAEEFLVRPRVMTLEGRGWRLDDLVDCLLRHTTVIVRCTPLPDDTTVLALRVVRALRALGFTGFDALLRFQSDRGVDGSLPIDRETLAVLGLL